MDAHAAREARRKAIKADLAEAYDDDEASPPEWADLLVRTTSEKQAIRDAVEAAADAFVNEPDIRRALADRERFASRTTERIAKLNALTERLNLLAPHSRFTRAGLDVQEILRPLFNRRRAAG